MTMFSDLGLMRPLLRAVETAGYVQPTPIQIQAIPPLLAGRDLLGVAQTGTGKTAAFTLPLLQRLWRAERRPKPRTARVLIMTPTRELAIQIGESFANYGRHLRLRHTVIFGGVGQRPQVRALAQGVDVLVATPGRLLDLMGQGHLYLDDVEAFVLDEADRMLDMGFIHDVRRVVRELPNERQTLLFSATMPATIGELAGSVLRDYVRVDIAPKVTTVERIEQRVLFLDKGDKRRLLGDLLGGDDVERAIVFTRTKRGADRVAQFLSRCGVTCDAIHGNKSQNARQRALAAFSTGRVRALVATDIAARGIDVDDVTHVINFDLPNEPESYVHRIGRTARAGAAGVALSFCDAEEVPYLRAIERTIRQAVPIDAGHAYHCDKIATLHRTQQGSRAPAPSRRGPQSGGQRRGGSSRRGARASMR